MGVDDKDITSPHTLNKQGNSLLRVKWYARQGYLAAGAGSSLEFEALWQEAVATLNHAKVETDDRVASSEAHIYS